MVNFSSAVDRLSKTIATLANWLVLASVLISALNAVARYALNLSSNAFLEIQWQLFGAVVLLGAADALRTNNHVRVDLIYGAVSPRVRLWIDIFGLTVFLIPVSAYLSWLSLPQFLMSFASGEASSNAGGLIVWPVKLLLPVGFGLLVLQGLSELLKRILALARANGAVAAYERPLQ